MKIFNKKANFDYILEPERVEAGISLSGGEAKAIRTGHADLNQSVARVVGGEIWLINANIPVEGAKNYNSTRMRRLLLHRSEILSISTKMKQRKLTIVPISMYNKRRLVKVELALGKPKKKFEKRETIRQKDIQRDIEIEFRGKP